MKIFSNAFLDALTEDEYSLLYATLNNNREVLYEIEWARADILINKLHQAPVNESGNTLKVSIFNKYQTLG